MPVSDKATEARANAMDARYLTDQVRQEILRTDAAEDIAETIVNVFVREGLDLLREPSLEDMKQILVEAHRAADRVWRTAGAGDYSSSRAFQ